jgi:hypothetical protein
MKRIGKVGAGSAALFGAVLSGVYVLVLALSIYILGIIGFIGEGKLLGNFLGLTVGTALVAILAGFIAALVGAVAGLVYALVYNIVAGLMGGLQIELRD